MAVTHGGGAIDQEPPDRSLVQVSHFQPRELNTIRSDKPGTHQASRFNAGGKAKKVIDLNKQAEEDGNLDLNVAADTLGVTYSMQKVDKGISQWNSMGLDYLRSKETYERLKEQIQNSDEQNRFPYLTKEDTTSLPGFQNSELIAVCRSAAAILGNKMCKIDHNLVSQPISDAHSNVPSASAISEDQEKPDQELYPNNEGHGLDDGFAKFASPEYYDVDLEWTRLGGDRLTFTEMLCNEDEP
ncbi:unnamed protein product [Microthlaspi erraticum]|uniref:Uncharacterized protein n=1 Tax=Microthlaspi erraticum TaxID=1685480 RepID=A0A6D2KWF2_9BRAS|nr:unnamed protein product [Microthlaspi erraticum]